MPLVIEDRVKEVSSSTGTGAIALSGNIVGFRRFSDVCSLGDTVYAAVVAVSASGVPTGEWEIGLYTYSAANTLSRTAVYSSSNNDTTVSFSAGTKHVYIDFVAQQIKSLATGNANTAVKPYGLNPNLFTSLKFSDDFDGNVLDATKWDNKLWYETAPSVNNYNVSGGCLNIWPLQNSDGTWMPRHIPSKFYQIYGYYEIEADLPIGAGISPSLWLFSHDLDEKPTVDIMKTFGSASWQNGSREFIDWQSTVYNLNGTPLGTVRALNSVGTRNLSNGFRKFGTLWEPDGFTFYVDGVQLGAKIMTGTTYRNRMYPILSLDVGKAGSASGVPSVSTTPQGESNALKINYLRIWQLANAPAGSDNPTAPGTGTPTTPGTGTGGASIIGYYGDSTVKGWDATIGDGTVVATPAPAAMAAALGSGYTVFNRGVHGASTSELLAGTDGHDRTWANEMAASTAQYVIMNLCLNDASTGSLSVYQANLQTIINVARAAGKTIIFETPNPADAIPALGSFVTAMKTIASNNTVPIIDQYTMLQSYMQQNNLNVYNLCPDGLHPSQAIYTRKGQYAATRFLEIRAGAGGTPEPGGGTSGAGPLGQDASLWTLTFEDNFNGTTLDRTKWTPNGGPRISNSTPNTWKLENGDLVLCYQAPFQRGNCTISTDPQGTNINGGFAQMHGFFEARIKCPSGPYVFPAFWLFANDTREIDIMENFSGDDSGQAGGTWRTTDNHPINAAWTVHRDENRTSIGSAKLSDHYYKNNTMVGQFPHSWLGTNVIDLSADYHTYACEWEPGRIRFWFDGKPWTRNGETWFTHALLNEMNAPMYMMLDFWIDSRTSDGGCPRGFGPWEMRVSHVRAWRRK